MSIARASARLGRTAPAQLLAFRRQIHHPTVNAGGLLRAQAPLNVRQSRKRPWPFGVNLLHNVPAVRAISFAKVLPNLAFKLVRLPAMLGAATISGLAYIQYQATRNFHLCEGNIIR